MSSTPEVTNVKNYLKQQFIVTSTDWIQACIDFLKQEHNQNLSLQSLKTLVYQQWLIADLDEIGVSVLPTELIEKSKDPRIKKITLNGSYALQVDGIRDVGKPAYTQLKELERNVNSNAEFSAAPEATTEPWVAKPTRMLMLNLTDGRTQVQGMEYKPLNSFSPNLPPGSKVQIQGPVDCRLGVLMLTSQHIKVLGGEVEAKLTQYSRVAILRDLLQLPSPEENEATNSEELSSNEDTLSSTQSTIPISNHVQDYSSTTSSNNSTQQLGRNTTVSRQQSLSSTSYQRDNHGVSNNLNNFQNGSLTFQPQNASSSAGNGNADFEDLDAFETEDDDFEQGLDYTVLDEIEKETLNKSKSFECPDEDQDVWLEDEDVVQDLMAFQDEDPGFHFPFEERAEESPRERSSSSGIQMNRPFSYLSSALENPGGDCIVTIKGFIITVLSKLECTMDKGWSLIVKINDGTASLDVNIHDKVIEGIIGISAPAMVKMQQTADTAEKRKEIMQAISKFKATLQDYNCLMDVKFTPGAQPSLVKCYPLSQLHTQQLLERVKSYS